MKKIFPILFLITSCSTQSGKIKNTQLDTIKLIKSLSPKVISDSTNTLTGKTEYLELSYVAFGCACANWVTTAEYDKYQDNKLAEHCIFIEPANDSLEIPLYFNAQRHKIKIKGQFYTKPDYPKGTIQTEEELEKAKVFRYTEIEVKKKEINTPPLSHSAHHL